MLHVNITFRRTIIKFSTASTQESHLVADNTTIEDVVERVTWQMLGHVQMQF